MKVSEWVSRAMGLAVYPGQGTSAGVIYTALGLCGESGEVIEPIKKAVRDSEGTMPFSKRQELMKELGDVIWYTFAFCKECRVSWQSLFDRGGLSAHTVPFDGTTEDAQRWLQSAHHNRSPEMNALRLADRVGRIAGVQESTPGMCPDINLMKSILTTVADISANYGFTIGEVFDINLAKLESRKKRGVLHGSGNDR